MTKVKTFAHLEHTDNGNLLPDGFVVEHDEEVEMAFEPKWPANFNPSAVVLPYFPPPVLRLRPEDLQIAPTLREAVALYLEAMGVRRKSGEANTFKCGCDLAPWEPKPCKRHYGAIHGRDEG